MNYVNTGDFYQKIDELREWLRLTCEYGRKDRAEEICARVREALESAKEELSTTPPDPKMAALEPNGLEEIRALRPQGPRKLILPGDAELAGRMAGAVLGRFAACLLGVPVEGWQPKAMEELAEEGGIPFPPNDYWPVVRNPNDKQYEVSPRSAYTRDGMDGVAVDDDITYTILGLLILEKYGPDFTTADVGQFWSEHLDKACTAEWIALENLKKGVPAARAGAIGNPYQQWIGADIRSDPWGWACAGNPERAAEYAWRDAYLSHRRGGIYGEMFFAAAQAAAFCTESPEEALRIGLTEIPADCALAVDVRWALEHAGEVKNWADARRLVDERFEGMHAVHTNNNACLTIFGLLLGEKDFTRTIGEIVAMGMDNDCTAATAGSILGAVIGSKRIPAHWTRNFHNKVYTYIKGFPELALDDVINRFLALAKQGATA